MPLEGFFDRNYTNTMNRIITYLKETRAEFRHVSWPTSKQATISTALVIAISLVTALFLGFFDFVFTTLLEQFVI
jgi:preprotein translocase subunit SecE